MVFTFFKITVAGICHRVTRVLKNTARGLLVEKLALKNAKTPTGRKRDIQLIFCTCIRNFNEMKVFCFLSTVSFI